MHTGNASLCDVLCIVTIVLTKYRHYAKIQDFPPDFYKRELMHLYSDIRICTYECMYIHTYIHTYIVLHTYIQHTYIHTYIPVIYIHKLNFIFKNFISLCVDWTLFLHEGGLMEWQ